MQHPPGTESPGIRSGKSSDAAGPGWVRTGNATQPEKGETACNTRRSCCAASLLSQAKAHSVSLKDLGKAKIKSVR